jgi:hypothetical protein
MKMKQNLMHVIAIAGLITVCSMPERILTGKLPRHIN